MVKGTKKNNVGKSRRFKDIKEGNCIFPFIFNGKVFNECIPDEKGKYNGMRCATEVDGDKKMLKWAYCPKTKKISKKKKVSKNKNNSKNSSLSSIKIPDSIDESNLRLPKWWSNSCFIDSVLVCLFLRPHPYILNRLLETHIHPFVLSPGKFSENTLRERTNTINSLCSVKARKKIRKELLNIYNYIHNNISNNRKIDRKSKTGTKLSRRVRNFRESLSDCVLRTYEDFTDGAQREANEFLKYLFSLFPQDTPNLKETTYFTNDTETEVNTADDIEKLQGEVCSSVTNFNTDVLYFLSPYDIFNSDDTTHLSDFFESKEESLASDDNPLVCGDENKNYLRAIKFKEFTEERYIIFDLSRSLGEFLDNEIIPDEEIELSNGKKFKFVSSVHRTTGMGSAHFTSFVLINDKWYFVDDSPGRKNPYMEEVGDYEDLLYYEDGMVSQCVMYFYEPM